MHYSFPFFFFFHSSSLRSIFIIFPFAYIVYGTKENGCKKKTCIKIHETRKLFSKNFIPLLLLASPPTINKILDNLQAACFRILQTRYLIFILITIILSLFFLERAFSRPCTIKNFNAVPSTTRDDVSNCPRAPTRF